MKSGHWRQDFLASLVVFLVALPLSLGIAVASGAPVVAGVVAAVCGGILVGFFGGAPLLVSGPAAGLTVLVFDVIQEFGFAGACAVFAVAGVMQIALGVARVARFMTAIPPAVVHGMLAGIGVVIAVAQFQVILGGTPQSSVLANLGALPANLAGAGLVSVGIGALTLAILVLWPRLKFGFAQRIPGSLVAILVATAASLPFGDALARVQIGADLFGSLTRPDWAPAAGWGRFALSAAVIALIASVESLLSAIATDKMHAGPRANLDRELIGQGVANLASGMAGGIPVTGVIVRSSANVASGARTRWSAILHGVWILVFVVGFSAWISKIPMAALAGLLVLVGVNLVKPAHVRELGRFNERGVYFVTLFGILATNLLAGIGMGLAYAALRLNWKQRHAEFELRDAPKSSWTLRVKGESLCFLSVPRLNEQLRLAPADVPARLHVECGKMDHAVFEAIVSWKSARERMGAKTNVEGL